LKEWTVGAAEAGVRLDLWLARQPEGGSRSKAKAWLERGKVFLNGAELSYSDAGRRVAAGDRIGLWIDRPGTATATSRGISRARSLLSVVLEDESLVVVNKPPGLIVEPLPGREREEVTVLDLVTDHVKATGVVPRVVHRIDRDTSGLVLFARTLAAQQALKEQFEHRTAERVYLAVVQGRLEPASGVWSDQLVWDAERLRQRVAHPTEDRARAAAARYRVLEVAGGASLLEVSLVSGKRNQIRVQAGRRGHPLVGERQYLFGHVPGPGAPNFARQALHARRLAFNHPLTGRRVLVTAPIPEDLRGLLRSLGVKLRLS
jgi:23S rRNA pseudouridine1911/1915/1917 synthase